MRIGLGEPQNETVISLGLLFVFAGGAGVFALQLPDGDAPPELADGLEALAQSAGPPITELIAMGERPAKRALARLR